MDGGGKELVNFSLGWGFFQTDDEVTNGWSVSPKVAKAKADRKKISRQDPKFTFCPFSSAGWFQMG